ncbi:hypothetical protein C8C83_4470 [Flavobacterium sp. 90]|uniref:hypothetical protein n=1 Tax=unclassified Flavobacterium TaxID=196869 RepID=UPI000EB00E6A|nr:MULTISPECIES: hypothetical protein [unclassified Flavobacterium]RKR05138.1 hypothetical protein C8C82_4811 [Flavobacterium sp. 81]TCK56453.1 hypothetical protein C8C83_4470 [Flavobacterium sp. 90]
MSTIKKYAPINILIGLIFTGFIFVSCKKQKEVDSFDIEKQFLAQNGLDIDKSINQDLRIILEKLNLLDSKTFNKKLKLAEDYNAEEPNEILVIPYSSTRENNYSEGFSDIKNQLILLNISAIRNFAAKNALSGEKSLLPVVELIILHEIGHFILGKEGAFDEKLITVPHNNMIEKTQPEFITTLKKIELDADSLAIDLLKKGLKQKNNFADISNDLQLLLPGLQFQMFGNRLPDSWFLGGNQILHDPSIDYPNMELRVMFMNYFLYPTEERRSQIQEYLYNRTVTPIHLQEFTPQIYQGEKDKSKWNLSD